MSFERLLKAFGYAMRLTKAKRKELSPVIHIGEAMVIEKPCKSLFSRRPYLLFKLNTLKHTLKTNRPDFMKDLV